MTAKIAPIPLDQLLHALRAAGEPTRIRILAALRQNELTVSELTYILDQSQPRVSRHLKLLCDSGLLQRYQEGAWVFHRISDQYPMQTIASGLTTLIDMQDPGLVRDQKKLQEVRLEKTRRAEEYFSEHAGEWDTVRSMIAPDRAIEARLLQFAESIRANLFLDLGTGTGRILEIFSPQAVKGIGYDLNRAMLTVARSKLENAGIINCTVRQGDICNINLPDNCADLITIHQVLHYCENPAQAIGEAARLLHPGGELLIVDLLPHDVEFLRERHAHRRLGFAPDTMATWCHSHALSVARHEVLTHHAPDQESLDVGLWQIIKPN